MIVRISTVIFRVLCIMSVLVAAKHAANAVALKCKVFSLASKCILIYGCTCKGKGHHYMGRV